MMHLNHQNIFRLIICSFFLTVVACKGAKKTTTDTTDDNQGTTTTGLVEFTSSNSLFALLDQAEAENKLVFVDVYTTWCLPCRLMDEEVFTDQKVANFLNDNFINYKVDAEKDNGPSIAAVYEVGVYPTLLFMDGQGRVLVKKEGVAMQTELLELARQALDQ